MEGNPEAAAAAVLDVRGLEIRRGERQLFAGLSLSVAPGQVALLTGPNGTGKTTLLLALAGIVRPEAGEIRFPAHRGEEGTRPAMHLLGYQQGIKPRLTVLENLSFWRQVNGAGGLVPQAALEETGIASLAALEAGYLSSGQTRRLALARLLVTPRPIWLLDEPSATLDSAGEALLVRLIEAHRQGGGVAVIATHHELGLAEGAGIVRLPLGGKA
jgi:heme exporter protein A